MKGTKNMLSKKGFDSLVGFLQGASWATVIIGAYLFFTLFYPFGLIVALIGGFFGATIGLFMVIFFEMAHTQEETLSEAKEQTKLLRELLEKK
jgi:membrane associated rhomboid family serine protease